MLEKHLVIVKDACNVPDDDSVVNESGVRLFKNSTPGIVFDHVDEIQGPQKKPKLLPRRGIDENSKEFRRQLLSIAVDGKDILAAARYASQRSLARLEAKEATAKEKAKREEARIAELKRIRGERWLPSMAREMQVFSLSMKTNPFGICDTSPDNAVMVYFLNRRIQAPPITKLQMILAISMEIDCMELHCSTNHMLPNSKMVAQVKMGSNAEAAAFFNLFVKKPWKMTVVSITPSLRPLRFLPTNPLFLQLQNSNGRWISGINHYIPKATSLEAEL
ncbi:hypothetical protein GOBAR_AA01636 [Gossypium barbadense]|uniref:Uncharacterized protein n=1 Tax=Gossypium barbadense TaxID=3634 RepID=A0A2P5YTL7_GOSBA|nr:hypothetical protein GOBAR_AA01636 [Gossypium barbadense]